MINQRLFISWAFLYGICAALGFLPEPTGALSGLMILLSVAFFVPPAILLYRAVKGKEYFLIAKIKMISLLSLSLTLLVLIVNFLSVGASAAAGLVLYWLLILVSAPMICSQMWIVPLFCWGCLLTVCLQYGKKKGK